MALDGIFLSSIVSELKDSLLETKIDKINQPEKDEILLTFRGIKNKKLLISASPTYPRIHFTSILKDNPKVAPMFCMVLRKHLIGGRIKAITQHNNDRIITIDIANTDEMGFDSVYMLIIEIMGRHSNISLVRKRDFKVMDCVKHISSAINSFRVLLPGVTYIFPPISNKLNPFTYKREEVKHPLEGNFDEGFYFQTFTGISKVLSKELFYRVREKGELNKDLLLDVLDDYIMGIKSGLYSFTMYHDFKPREFYCTELYTYEKYQSKKYENASELLETFYSEKDKLERIKNRTQNLEKIINTNLERCYKKVKILDSAIVEANKKDVFKIYGELLTANIYSIKEGQRCATLWDYYSEDNSMITIPLDPNKSPSENIQSYYKKYNKLKKSEEAAFEQLKITEEEIDYLTSVMNSISNITAYEEIHEIREELMEAGYIRYRKSKDKPKATKPHHFISSQGHDIYVGRNNLQNDYLTLRFAGKTDTWFHTKNIPGSHVIVKGNNLPEETIMEAASLAAYFSKGKASSKVPVDYTEVRNVKKPNGAKPGMVIYNTNKTIYVDPEITVKKREE